MKIFLKSTLAICLLLTVVSCGEDDDNDNSSNLSEERHRRKHRHNCQVSSTTAAWKEFVNNVKELNFNEDFSPHACWESTQVSKLPNRECKWWGCFQDGTSYTKPEGSKVCTSGALHEKDLIDLVKKTPLRFEAEFCDDKMVGGAIAIKGKGIEGDVYRFNFELPASFNPVFKKVWKDADRRFEVKVRH